MGFSTLIDILGSSLVGGMLLLILFRVNDTAIQNNYVYGGDLIVQEALVEAVRVIEYDFRKIGYCADYTKIGFSDAIITIADTSRIEFITDIATSSNPSGDGILDTIEYRLGPVSELANTTNPRDRILYRIVNHEQPKGSNIGITQFDLIFFDASNDTLHFPISDTRLIYTMQIDLTVENTDAVVDVYSDDPDEDSSRVYSQAVWRQIRLASKNLRNR